MSATVDPSIAAAFGSLPSQALSNPILAAGGPLALYNVPLLNISTGLFMHGFIFGLLLMLRRFNLAKVVDLRYLSMALSLSLIIAPAVFLFDYQLDVIKFYFFTAHEALEVLIACVILTPQQTMERHCGKILMLLWAILCMMSIAMSLQEQIHHAADIAAWGAFCSDSSLGVTGVVLVVRWHRNPKRTPWKYALAGLGHSLHGFSTLCVPPIFAAVLYSELDPVYFAWSWWIVFVFALGTIGCTTPLIGDWAADLRWNCGGSRQYGVQLGSPTGRMPNESPLLPVYQASQAPPNGLPTKHHPYALPVLNESVAREAIPQSRSGQQRPLPITRKSSTATLVDYSRNRSESNSSTINPAWDDADGAWFGYHNRI